ncbi:thiol-disulfide oxidoreductase DCC family protein [Dactylosporangium cerinum]
MLYDAGCGLCRTARTWLASRAQLVPLEFVPAGSDEARRRYPALDPAETLADITVVADDGGVYTGDGAWIICLWALDGYRGLAARLSRPELRPTARRMVAAAAAVRRAGLSAGPVTAEPGSGPGSEQGYGSDCGGTCDV